MAPSNNKKGTHCFICGTALSPYGNYCRQCKAMFLLFCPCGEAYVATAKHCNKCHRSLQDIQTTIVRSCERCNKDYTVTEDEVRKGKYSGICPICEQQRQQASALANSSQIVSSSGKDPLPHSGGHDVSLGAVNNQTIKLSFADRPLGVVLLGQTGFGKTSLMEHMLAEDIGRTTSIILDPHGELSERILRIGAGINSNNILFCEIGNNLSYGFNPLEVKTPGDLLEESQTIDSLLQVFRKHWGDNPAFGIGSRAEWVLANTARTILANPGYTLAEIPLLLHDKAFRDKLVRNVMNPTVQHFWGEYRQLEATRRPLDVWQLVESTVTRLSQFLANEWLYRVLYQAKGTIKFHELIDSGKTIVFSLPIGKLGEQPASLLGSLLLGKLATTIFSRNEYGRQYPRLHIYIDEFSRFSTQLISSVLFTQARKFNVGATITLQTLSQIKDDESRAAVLQAGNLIAFQLIGSDAEIIAKQMPLPDPVSLMKPEPILLYSHTPVEDIWHKGHPNKDIQIIRDNWFWIVGDMEREPKQDCWQFNISTIITRHPDWRTFDDWEMYRSSTTMLKEGLRLLNQYIYNWMDHQYSLEVADVSPEEVLTLCNLVENWGGYFGFRPVMVPYIEEQKWHAILRHWQENFDRDVRGILDRQEQKWHYRGVNDVQTVGEMKANMRKSGLFRYKDVPVDTAISTFLPSDLPWVRDFLLDQHLSSYEVDNLIQWKFRQKIDSKDDDLLAKLIMSILYADGEITKTVTKYKEDYRNHLIALIGAQKNFALGQSTAQDITPEREQELTRALYRGEWQAMNLIHFVASCLISGEILAKEPVFDTSHSYKDVELNRRTYSDLRDELVSKLVSLPPYNAICTLASKSGELPIQILTPRPLPISPDVEPKAQAVREESRKKLGHPWQEVVKDIQTRQNLPPAKPHIPHS